MKKFEKKIRQHGISSFSKDVGVSRETIYNWFDNPEMIQICRLKKISGIFSMSINDTVNIIIDEK